MIKDLGLKKTIISLALALTNFMSLWAGESLTNPIKKNPIIKGTVIKSPNISMPGKQPTVTNETLIKTIEKARAELIEVDTWLTNNPTVAFEVRWNFVTNNRKDTNWKNWTEAEKADLRNVYNSIRNAYDYTTGLFKESAIDISLPDNLNAPEKEDMLISQTDMYQLYLKYVAVTLFLEIKKIVPWTITNLPKDILQNLINGNYWVWWSSKTPVQGFHMKYTSLPTDPLFTFNFLRKSGIIKATRKDTIIEVIAWSRRLIHTFGVSNGSFSMNYWQYIGAPPVSRIIEGTIALNATPNSKYSTTQHWTNGCSGTTAFLGNVFRVVNIPMFDRSNTCGHRMPYFPTEELYLSHGDDPYNRNSKPGKLLPGLNPKDFLITKQTWLNWFGPEADIYKCEGNTGRKIAELAVQNLTDNLLLSYCSDVKNSLNHANGKVYKDGLYIFYTVQELEMTYLWERLEAKSVEFGGCSNVISKLYYN